MTRALRPEGAAALLGAVALSLAAPAVGAEPLIRSVLAEQGAFVVRLSDGRILRSPDLIGAVLHVEGEQGPLAIRIDGVETDARSGLLLHALSVRNEAGAFEPWCEPDGAGRRAGFPLAGRSLPDGGMAADPERFELVCTSGARGKCARMGYAPWRHVQEGRRLDDAFEACVRMLRADYCGDGASATRDGTEIDVYDDLGVQASAPDPAVSFEAGWTAAGATCVRRPRIGEQTTLDALAARCPRLAGRLGDACSEASARAEGALLFNRSRP